jgi:hypothetical protein
MRLTRLPAREAVQTSLRQAAESRLSCSFRWMAQPPTIALALMLQLKSRSEERTSWFLQLRIGPRIWTKL